MSAGDVIAVFALALSVVGFIYTYRVNNSTKRKELNDILAELHMIRNQYIRLERSGNTEPDTHSVIVSKAQYLVRRASWYKSIDDGLNAAYEKAKAESQKPFRQYEFEKFREKGKSSLPFIAKTRLTVNQTTFLQVNLDDESKLHLGLFGAYPDRNE